MNKYLAVIAGVVGVALFAAAAHLAVQNPPAGPVASLASEPPNIAAPGADDHERGAPFEQRSATRPATIDDEKVEPISSTQTPPTRRPL